MATKTYAGSVASPTSLNSLRTVSLSTSDGNILGVVTSVLGKFRFSTNAYGTTYGITATLRYTGGTKSVTRNIKMDSSNYTDAIFDFTFATGIDPNAVQDFTIIANNNGDKVFIKGGQQVLITYTPATAPQPPLSATLSASLTETSVTLSCSGADHGASNLIEGYAIEYAESADNKAWGPWQYLKAVATSNKSFSTSVNASSTRGYYRKYRVQTLGELGLDSDWKDATGSVRRNSAPTAPDTVTIPGLFESLSLPITWSGEADADGNISQFEIEYATSANNSTWGSWTALGFAASSPATKEISVGRGSWAKVRVRVIDAFDVTSGWAESASGQRNRIPGAPTIDYPAGADVTPNKRPRILITIGSEPDGQLQTMASPGWVASTQGGLLPGKQIVLKRTVDISGASHSIKTQDEMGTEGTPATALVENVPPGWTDTLASGTTRIKAQHMNEIRGWVNDIEGYYGITPTVWAEEITQGITSMSGWTDHMLEIRAAIAGIADVVNGWDETAALNKITLPAWVPLVRNRPSAAAMNQLRTVIEGL